MTALGGPVSVVAGHSTPPTVSPTVGGWLSVRLGGGSPSAALRLPFLGGGGEEPAPVASLARQGLGCVERLLAELAPAGQLRGSLRVEGGRLLLEVQPRE